MRDPNRLNNFYEEVKKLHKQHFPDWRFGQFINNIQNYYWNDLFYLEDEKMLGYIREYCNKYGKKEDE